MLSYVTHFLTQQLITQKDCLDCQCWLDRLISQSRKSWFCFAVSANQVFQGHQSKMGLNLLTQLGYLINYLRHPVTVTRHPPDPPSCRLSMWAFLLAFVPRLHFWEARRILDIKKPSFDFYRYSPAPELGYILK